LRLLVLHLRPRIISPRPIQDAIGGNFGEAANRDQCRCARLAVSAQIATRAKEFMRAIDLIGLCVAGARPGFRIDIGLLENGAP
jgi:hypothetical protein